MGVQANDNNSKNKSINVNIPEHAVKNLTVEQMYDKEKYDLSTMKEDDVFKMLDATRDGLTDDQVNERREKFGLNRLDQKRINPIVQFLLFMWNPLSWVMEAAAFIAIALTHGSKHGLDWQDFVGIVFLLFINAIIGFIEQRNAGNAVKELMKSLAPEAQVKRNGVLKSIDASELVPGDVISFKLGNIIPADCRLIAIEGEVSIDQAALTGESLPVNKAVGDEVFSGSTCKQGEGEAIVIGTGPNTFFGRAAKLVGSANDEIGHLQTILAKIGNFCIAAIAIFIIAEILVMYIAFHYRYHRGINNILVLLIGGIPIAMPTVLSVTLAIGAKQLSEHKAIVTHVTAIEELAAVTILCSDKTGTLTLNKLVIDKTLVKKYSDIDTDEIIHNAAIASKADNPDAIDSCVVSTYGDAKKIRDGIQVLEFKPFNPKDKRTEITYKQSNDGSVHRISKGMASVILDLCSRDKTDEQIRQLNQDVDEFAQRGLRALAVATEDVLGNGFKLIGLLPIYDPPREDTKETIQHALELGVQVKMLTGDQLEIAKETARRLGMGDRMFASKTLKDGPSADSGYHDIDDLVLHADGFAGVYPEHKYEIVDRLQKLGHMIAMTGDGVNDAPALAKANVGVAVADASDAARSAADIVLTQPGLSVIIDALLGSRQIFQRMRNYAIYTCSITIRILVGFSVLVFAYKFDFPSFMILILAILNDGTILTISKDRVKPSRHPNCWNLTEIFVYAIVYGTYLAASTIVFFTLIVETRFFQDRFGVEEFFYNSSTNWNHPMLNSIIYLQVSTISQALIFITRSHNFFFLERPSLMLIGAFLLAQFIATIIAVYAIWDFTGIHACGWKWAAIVWIWNLLWFFPLDLLKLALRLYFNSRKTSSDNSPSQRLNRMNSEEKKSSQQEIFSQATARYYIPHTQHLSTANRHRNFAQLFDMKNSPSPNFTVDRQELQRFSLVQADRKSVV